MTDEMNCKRCGKDLVEHNARNLLCPDGAAWFEDAWKASFDGRVWAEHFVKYAVRYPAISTDVGTMTGWFAAALMRGYDESEQKHAADHSQPTVQPVAHPERPKLTSVYPDLTDGTVLVLAACDTCGSVQVFNHQSNNRFPDTGLWTECRACAAWRTFYRLRFDDLMRPVVVNENRSYRRK